MDELTLKFIDAHVDLHSEINSVTITNQLPMHRTKASRLISIYKEKNPGNIKYDLKSRMYKKGFLFKMNELKDISSFSYLNAIEIVFNKTEVKK